MFGQSASIMVWKLISFLFGCKIWAIKTLLQHSAALFPQFCGPEMLYQVRHCIRTQIFSLYSCHVFCISRKTIHWISSWNTCCSVTFHKRHCYIWQVLHACTKCICRTCEVIHAVSEDDKIYYITSPPPPITGHQARDFVILVSRRQPLEPRWAQNFKLSCELWTHSLNYCWPSPCLLFDGQDI